MKFAKAYRYWIILSLISLVGLGLRLWHYPSFPSMVETADERAWAWLGASLIQEQQPTSWSLFPAYQKNFIYKKLNNHAPLVRPFLDHPPLFALIPGSIHLLQAKNWQAWPSQKAIRFPMVLIGTLNIFLLGLSLKLYFPQKKDESINLITSLIFATLPLIVFTSRLAVADNLLATFSLVMLIALKKHWYWLVYLVIILAGLGKIQGLFIAGGVIFYAWFLKDKRLLLGGLLSALISLTLFYLYGTYYNQALFLQIFLSQSGRQIGLITLLHRFFFYPTLVSHFWPVATKSVLALASVFILWRAKLKHSSSLLLPASLVLSYMLITLLAVDELNINAWYDYAIYPILFFGLKLLIESWLKKPSPLKSIGVYLIIILPSLRLLVAGLAQTANINPILVKLASLTPLVTIIKLNSRKTQKNLTYLFIGLFILTNIIIIFRLNQSSYSNLTFYLSQY